jgi:glutaredoxin
MPTHQTLILVFALAFVLPVKAEVSVWFDADGEAHDIGSDNDGLPSFNKSKNETIAAHVDLYVTSWCPYCKKAILFLQDNHIPFSEYDIEQDYAAADRKQKLAPDYGGVPLAVINGDVIRGFSEYKYRRALAKKAN